MLTYAPESITVSDRLAKAVLESSPIIHKMLLVCGTKNGRGDYLDISSKGQISYRPLNRIVEGQDPYAVKGRVQGKPAKILKSFLSDLPEISSRHEYLPFLEDESYPYNVPNISQTDLSDLRQVNDRHWEAFSNTFMAITKEVDPESIRIVVGEDIRNYYHERSHTKESFPAPLMNSCMRHEHCQPYLDLYVKNPEVCSMMVELDEKGFVRARALIWKTSRGKTFMDRIYGDNKSIAFFQNYAKERGWWFRAYNSYMQPDKVVVDGKVSTRRLRVKLEHFPEEYFPFCDTFKFISKDAMELTNQRAATKANHDLSYLEDTRGGRRTIRRSPSSYTENAQSSSNGASIPASSFEQLSDEVENASSEFERLYQILREEERQRNIARREEERQERLRVEQARERQRASAYQVVPTSQGVSTTTLSYTFNEDAYPERYSLETPPRVTSASVTWDHDDPAWNQEAIETRTGGWERYAPPVAPYQGTQPIRHQEYTRDIPVPLRRVVGFDVDRAQMRPQYRLEEEAHVGREEANSETN